MNRYTPIICPKCKKDTGLKAENFTNIVLTSNVKCPHCQYVLIYANYVECSTMAYGTESEKE